MAYQGIIWKKRILIPFWVIRILMMIFIVIAFSYGIKLVKDDPTQEDLNIGSIVVFMLFLVAVLLLDVLAILLFLRDALNPFTFMTMNFFQTGFWIGVVIVNAIAVGKGTSAGGLGFSIFVLLTFLALLIYAIVGYRRQKKQSLRGNYAPALNPSAPVAPGYHPPPFMNAAPYQQNPAYVPEYVPQNVPAPAPVELQDHKVPSYHEQPVKPTQIV